MARSSHFDTENFEASVTKYLRTQFKDYEVLFEEVRADSDTYTKWFVVEFLGNNGMTTTQHPVNHLMVHIRTRGDSADADMALMLRLAEESLLDKMFDLYDTQDKNVIGYLRSEILREFPKEP